MRWVDVHVGEPLDESVFQHGISIVDSTDPEHLNFVGRMKASNAGWDFQFAEVRVQGTPHGATLFSPLDYPRCRPRNDGSLHIVHIGP